MTAGQRVAELESEVYYLRSMINVEADPEIRNLAASLIALLLVRLLSIRKGEK